MARVTLPGGRALTKVGGEEVPGGTLEEEAESIAG